MALELAYENIWFDKWRVDDAERQFYEKASRGENKLASGVPPCVRHSCTGRQVGLTSKCGVESEGGGEPAVGVGCRSGGVQREAHPPSQRSQGDGSGLGLLATKIAKARQEIQNSLVSTSGSSGSSGGGGGGGGGPVSSDVLNRITKLETQNSSLVKTVSLLEKTVIDLTKRLESLEVGAGTTTVPTAAATKPEPVEEDEDDDEVDLFGSDSEEEDEAAARVREERLKAYADKKSKKPGPIAKSSVLLDCKPWDDETDMAAMESKIREIEMDGLNWGAAKLVPLAYGIQKLSILCTVEDEKVSIDELSEKIQEYEDYVQSVDIAAFNKI